MIIAILIVLGLCLGSFVNALVWRLHEQAKEADSKQLTARSKNHKKASASLSILNGRSMCPDCHHPLAARDLGPVLSWLSLGGKCRYCHQSISVQYPLVELTLPLLYVASYSWWPVTLGGTQTAIFVLWLVLLVGLLALTVYDLRWQLLPNRLIYPLGVVALVQAVIHIAAATHPAVALGDSLLAVLIGGGIFYLLFQMSRGRWIGGGDVRLGWLLGLIAATPGRSLLLIFLAAVLGSLVSLPLLAVHRLRRTSTIPFGPFLIMAIMIVVLFGGHLLHWYQTTFINF